MKDKFSFAQVIQELDGGKIKVYEIEDLHIGDDDDPLTTVVLTGKSKVIDVK